MNIKKRVSIRDFKKAPLVASVIAASLGLVSGDAMSQDAGFALEEIIVTAQKRSQSLQDVAMSVSAVTEEGLSNAGITNVQDVQEVIPALSINTTANPAQTSLSIRGAGTGVSDPTLEPSVGVFVDGVFLPRSVFGLSDLVDIDRVEVLLGPQGTLYGKNTNAGVISVHTKGMPDGFEGKVAVTLGDDDLQDTSVAVGGLITDEVGYRFAAKTRRRDGVLDSEVTGNPAHNQLDSQAYRAQLFVDPTDRLSVRTIAYYSLQDASRGEPERGFDTDSLFYLYANSVSAPATGSELLTDDEDRKTSIEQPQGGRLEVQGASVQVEYELSGGSLLTSISAYQEWEQDNLRFDLDGTPIPLLHFNDRMNEESLSQEFRITSPGGETIDWLGGFFYFKSQFQRGNQSEQFATFDETLTLGGGPLTFPVGHSLAGLPIIVAGDTDQWENQYETESAALFGQLTWNATDNTYVTLGLRYNQEKKDFTYFSDSQDGAGVSFDSSTAAVSLGGDGSYSGGYFGPLVIGNLGDGTLATFGESTLKGDRKESDFTGMLSLGHIIDSTLLYATVATGSKSGGFNGAFGTTYGAGSLDNREFDTEETISYEMGAKVDDLLDGRMRLNVAYFYTDYSDFQATSLDPQTSSFVVVNAGSQVTQGVDLELTYLASENWMLTSKVEYLDAKYRDYQGANCHPAAGGAGCDQTGQRLPFAANWAGSVTADYTLPLNSGAEFYAHVGLSFKTDFSASPTLHPAGGNQNFELWNARLGWRNDDFDISAWGRNLTDEIYSQSTSSNIIASNIFASADGGQSHNNFNNWVSDPRSVGVTARYSFY